ncbi:MAG: CDP-alcohol phosphatidyltransferase family protein [Acidimicrobiia bacterium]|nr:CDP-alcohol phosphatidyltransferase family protein [Acidimicrobiia bacterium]
MFDGHWRKPIDDGLRPLGVALRRAGITADVVTVVGIAMSGLCAIAIATGHFRLAVLLLALTGVPDALDGAVAKASGTSSVRGAFFDSVADRFTDAILFGGVAWHLAGRGGHLVMLPFALFGAASLVSYQRAKAESLGFDAKGGLMERAERFFVLGFGLLFSELLIGVLWVMFTLTAITAVQRFVKVWRQADRPPPRRSQHRPVRRRPRQPLSERWRELSARRLERQRQLPSRRRPR